MSSNEQTPLSLIEKIEAISTRQIETSSNPLADKERLVFVSEVLDAKEEESKKKMCMTISEVTLGDMMGKVLEGVNSELSGTGRLGLCDFCPGRVSRVVLLV